MHAAPGSETAREIRWVARAGWASVCGVPPAVELAACCCARAASCGQLQAGASEAAGAAHGSCLVRNSCCRPALEQVVHAADEHLAQLPPGRVVGAVCTHKALLLLLQRPAPWLDEQGRLWSGTGPCCLGTQSRPGPVAALCKQRPNQAPPRGSEASDPHPMADLKASLNGSCGRGSPCGACLAWWQASHAAKWYPPTPESSCG